MKGKPHFGCLTVAVCLLGFDVHADSPLTASKAEDAADPTVLQQVTVTARRREEHLADVPLAATVIDRNELAARGVVTDSGELLTGVPGVRFLDTTSPVTSEISIRGSSTSRGTNADPSVGLYRDGAYIGGGQIGGRNFTRLDLFDAARVEILRGTQGALYGRDAVGGAVNVISARPDFHHDGYADIQVQPNQRAAQLQAVVNESLNSHWALRLGLDAVDQNKGFFYDTDSRSYIDTRSGFGTRAQIRRRDDDWDINLLIEHQQLKVPTIAYYVYIAPQKGFPQGVFQDPYKLPFNTAPKADQDLNGFLLTADHEIEWAKFTSTALVRQRKTFYQYDADGTDPATLSNSITQHRVPAGVIDPNSSSANEDRTTTFSEELHFAGNASSDRLHWLVGSEILYQESHFDTDTGRSPTKANSSIGSVSPGRIDYRSVAAYGSLGYELARALNLTAEVRYTNDNKRDHINRYDDSSGAQTGGNAFNFTGKEAPDNVSYNFTGSYKLLPQTLRSVLAYAKVGTAYRSGGFNGNLGDPRQSTPIPVSYGVETTTAYEIGLKGELARNLSFALAGYRTHTRDVIVQTDNGCAPTDPACPVAPTPFLINGGDSDNWGLELQGSGIFAFAGGQLLLAMSGSHQQAEIKSGQYAGQNVPQVPRAVASADVDYRHPLYGGMRWFGHSHYVAQWGGVQELAVTPNFRLHDFQIIDARLGLDLLATRLEVAGFVRNAGDVVYITYEQATSRRLSQPLTWGAEIQYRW